MNLFTLHTAGGTRPNKGTPSPDHGQSITTYNESKWRQNLALRCVPLPALLVLGVPTKTLLESSIKS